MDGWPVTASWTPLAALRARFDANLKALRTRDSALAERIASVVPTKTYFLSVGAESVRLGIGSLGSVQPLENPVAPNDARQIIQRLAAGPGVAQPLLVAGLDHGWLWESLSRLTPNVPTAPGHRPPLFFLARELERLWAIMHFQDWQILLADRRCIILAGEDVASQFGQYLVDHPEVGWPRVSITTDQQIWPAGESLDTALARADTTVKQRLDALCEQIDAQPHRHESIESIARKLKSGKPLRVLGFTSLYTTFLQHSMRDWLAGLETLGHTTRMLIEQHDHEKPHMLAFLKVIAEYQPDLIVMIDHFRAEFPRMPAHIPCVMWVQDRLPNIFTLTAGHAQGPMDFSIGYGRRDCVNEFEYPRARFMESPVGVNDARFAAELPKAELDRHQSDIAFVSHASATPQQLIEEQLTKNPGPEARKLFDALYERMNAIYSRGEYITQERFIHEIVDESLRASGVAIEKVQALIDFTTQKLNNAMFRHQAINWLVDAGYNIALYGNGWHNHPKFARFARGPADNERALAAIYRSAKINLQMTPFGSAHQRLFEGLCAGGFFLLRRVTGDDVEPVYVELWEFCKRNEIENNEDFRSRLDGRTENLINYIDGLSGGSVLLHRYDFVDALRALSKAGFIRTSSTLFHDTFEQVAFETRDQLLSKVEFYLKNPEERRGVAEKMRQRVIDTVTYRGISKRMIDFIANDLSARRSTLEAAA